MRSLSFILLFILMNTAGYIVYADDEALKAHQIDVFLEQLSTSTNMCLRRDAIEAIVEMGPEQEIIDILIEALRSDNKYLRWGAAETLGEFGPYASDSLDLLVEIIRDDELWTERQGVAKAIAKIVADDRGKIPYLVEAMRDWSGGDLARETLLGFGQEGLNALINALSHESTSVRKNAAYALRKVGPEASPAVPALIILLNDKSKEIPKYAAEALGNIGPAAKDAIPALKALLDTRHMWVAAEGVEAIGKIGGDDPEIISFLIDTLKNKHGCIKLAAMNALGGLHAAASSAVPMLIDLMDSEQFGVRGKAIETLGLIGPAAREAVSAIIEALDKGPRAEAMFALGRIGSDAKDAVPRLIEIMYDDPYFERGSAALALGMIGPPEASEAIPDLLELMKCNNPDNSMFSAMALSHIGKEDVDAVDGLIELLGWEDPDVSFIAAQTLSNIGEAAVPALINKLREQGQPIEKEPVKPDDDEEATQEDSDEFLEAEDTAPFTHMAGYDMFGMFRCFAGWDEDIDPRAWAAYALGDMAPDSRDSIPALISAIDDETPCVRVIAVEAIGWFGLEAEAAVGHLLEALGEEDAPVIRGDAVQALGLISRTPEVRSAIIDMLDDESPFVQGRAAMALGNFEPDPEAIDTLIELLESKSSYVRCHTAFTLGEWGSESIEALPALTRMLDDKNIDCTLAATFAVAEITRDYDDAVIILVEALSDVKTDWTACMALSKMGSHAKDAVPALIEGLDNWGLSFPPIAIIALGEIGPDAADALPKLRELTTNSYCIDHPIFDYDPIGRRFSITRAAETAIARIEGTWEGEEL